MESERYFKYTKKKFADAMIKHGEVRIGTVYEYRDYDNEEIKDADEGTSNLYQHTENLTVKSFEELPEHLRFDIPADFFENGGEINFINCHSYTPLTASNAYVYCVTKEASK